MFQTVKNVLLLVAMTALGIFAAGLQLGLIKPPLPKFKSNAPSRAQVIQSHLEVFHAELEKLRDEDEIEQRNKSIEKIKYEFNWIRRYGTDVSEPRPYGPLRILINSLR